MGKALRKHRSRKIGEHFIHLGGSKVKRKKVEQTLCINNQGTDSLVHRRLNILLTFWTFNAYKKCSEWINQIDSSFGKGAKNVIILLRIKVMEKSVFLYMKQQRWPSYHGGSSRFWIISLNNPNQNGRQQHLLDIRRVIMHHIRKTHRRRLSK